MFGTRNIFKRFILSMGGDAKRQNSTVAASVPYADNFFKFIIHAFLNPAEGLAAGQANHSAVQELIASSPGETEDREPKTTGLPPHNLRNIWDVIDWYLCQKELLEQIVPANGKVRLILNSSVRDSVGVQTIFSNDELEIALWILPKGCKLPIHDHPEMVVSTLAVAGRFDIDTYAKVEDEAELDQKKELDLGEQPIVSRPRGRSDVDSMCLNSDSGSNASSSPTGALGTPLPYRVLRQRLEEGQLAHISPVSNLHSIHALDHAAFLSVSNPSYDDIHRQCTYFRPVGQREATGQEDPRPEATEPPDQQVPAARRIPGRTAPTGDGVLAPTEPSAHMSDEVVYLQEVEEQPGMMPRFYKIVYDGRPFPNHFGMHV